MQPQKHPREVLDLVRASQLHLQRVLQVAGKPFYQRPHTAEWNCLPLSDVICSGMPNQATQLSTRAEVQLTAEMERRGIASA